MLELSFRDTAGFRVTTWGPFLQRRLRSTMPSAMQDAKHSAAKKNPVSVDTMLTVASNELCWKFCR